MVVSAGAVPRQELRDAEGRTFAYLVPAEEMDRVAAEVERLRAEVDVLRRQKESYVAQLREAYLTLAPPPPTEDEMRQAVPSDLSDIIAALGGEPE